MYILYTIYEHFSIFLHLKVRGKKKLDSSIGSMNLILDLILHSMDRIWDSESSTFKNLILVWLTSFLSQKKNPQAMLSC